MRRGLKKGKWSENPARRPRQGDKDLDRLKLLGQGQLLLLTPWPEVRSIRLDRLPSQQVTLGGQELHIVKIVVIHIMGNVGDLVFVSSVVNPAI